MADEALIALKAREAELAREWQWLVNALHIIAPVRAGDSAADAFRLLHDQCMMVGQRRVEMNLRIAALERSADVIKRNGPPRTLGDYHALKCVLHVTCRRCRHKHTLFLVPLIEQHGEHCEVDELRPRLRRSQCGYDAADVEPMIR